MVRSAANSIPSPVDLNKDYTQSQADGQLFFTLTRGRVAMPFYRDALSQQERWDVINYVQERVRQAEPAAMSVDTVTAQHPASSPRRDVALWVLIGLFALGVASLVYALRSETMQPDFRLLTVSFLYLMGISQAGVVFCAMTRLMRARWARPYYRLAELSTLAFFPFALVTFLLIYGYARNELFYWLTNATEGHPSPWLSGRLAADPQSLRPAALLRPERGLRDQEPEAGSARRHSPARSTHAAIERQLYLLSPWVLVAFVICNTLFAWDFGMMLIPHWHSTVFPIHFWFGNLFAGTAALILFPALLGRRAFRTGADPQPRHAAHRLYADVAVLLLGAVLRDLVRQPAARVRARVAADVRPLRSLLLEHDDRLFLPALCSVHLRRSSSARWWRCASSPSASTLGIWINKYLIVMPALVAGRSAVRQLARRRACARPRGRVRRDGHAARGQISAFSRWEMDLQPEPTRKHEYPSRRILQFAFASMNAAVVALNLRIDCGCTYIMWPAS